MSHFHLPDVQWPLLRSLHLPWRSPSAKAFDTRHAPASRGQARRDAGGASGSAQPPVRWVLWGLVVCLGGLVAAVSTAQLHVTLVEARPPAVARAAAAQIPGITTELAGDPFDQAKRDAPEAELPSQF